MKFRFILAVLALGVIAIFAWVIDPASQRDSSRPNEASLEAQLTPRDAVLEGLTREKTSSTPSGSMMAVPEVGEPVFTKVLVVVTQGERSPLEGALVILDDGASDQTLGRTDSQGEITIPGSSQGWMSVYHPNYAPEEVFVAKDNPEPRVVVELEPGGVIRGRLDAGIHSPGFEEFHVVGWDSIRPPSRSDWAKWLAGEPSRLLEASIGPDGTFELTGLAQGRMYRFLAGGPGYLTEGPSELILPGLETLSVRVSPMFGCRVVLEGNTHEASRGALPRFWSSSWVSEIGNPGTPIVFKDPKLLLCGIEDSFWGEASDVFLLYLGNQDGLDVPGPVEVEVAIPGMRPAHAVIELESTVSGLAELPLRLHALHGDSGNVRFEFTAGEGEQAHALEGAVGGINLKLWQDASPVTEYEILEISKPFTIVGLPYGAYNYRIQAGKGLAPRVSGSSYFEGHLLIGGDIQVIEVPFLSIGGIEVEFPLPNGFKYRGPAILTLSSLEKNGGDWPRVFRRPPYRFGAIPQGRYSVEAVSNSPGGTIQKVFKSPVILVSGGQSSVVEIPLEANDPNPF